MVSTIPSRWLRKVCSIFIASSKSSASPAFHLLPSRNEDFQHAAGHGRLRDFRLCGGCVVWKARQQLDGKRVHEDRVTRVDNVMPAADAV